MKTRTIGGTLALGSMGVMLTAIGACGGSGGTTGSGGSGQSSTQSSSTGQSAGGGGSGGDTGSGGNAGCTFPCTPTLGCAVGSEFCESVAEPVNCALVSPQDSVHVCGVPLGAAGADITRSSNVKANAGSGPPQLGCFGVGGYPAKPAASQAVKMQGIVRIFSHGCASKNVKIEVFPVKHEAGADDGNIGALVGAPVTTSSNCTAGGVAFADADCGTVYQCKYEYTGVPTETELVVKTSGDLWAPVYEYNVYIPNGGVKSGAFTRDLVAMASDDYNVLPQAAIGSPVTSGNGMVLGEVHDCGDVRLIGATADIDLPKKLVTYFSANEEHPLPDVAAPATGVLGLYAAIDVPPGAVRVAAVGPSAGDIMTLGFTRAHVFPDSVTLVTFRGLLPTQVP